MKVVTIVGARPQLIKAAAVSRQLRRRHQEILLHTGQHYDYKMSGVFFDGLEMPPPEINLEVGSGSHGTQTAAMLRGIEEALLSTRPDWVLVFGDTNSTLAGALAAAKLQLPVVHVEAGLRSYNRRMPEEINRVVVDHLSSLLLCPSNTGVLNLAAEGINRNVFLAGDVMLDVLNWAKPRAAARQSKLLTQLGAKERCYLLATVHRSENTDCAERLGGILKALNTIEEPVIFPIHPRARTAIERTAHRFKPHVKLIDPLGYTDMVALSSSARLILTDSGGLQKEAYWLGVPCITLREETEWVETVQAGWNTLAGTTSPRILEAVLTFQPSKLRVPLYGDGQAAVEHVRLLERTSSISPEAANGSDRVKASNPGLGLGKTERFDKGTVGIKELDGVH